MSYNDLIDEREAVLDAIRRLQHQHDSMEFFGARSDIPIETCLEEVGRSDVLVAIVGHRYGSLVPGMGVSFSEAEYTEGYRLGKPSLVYVIDENVPVLPKHMERDSEKIILLEKFKETLRIRHTVATFRDAHDLSLSVATDLSRTAQALEGSTIVEEELYSSDSSIIEINEITKEALDMGVSATAVVSAVRQSIASLLSDEGKRHPLVFFSYSHADKNIVRDLASALRDHEIDVWIDERDLKFSSNILGAISKGLDSADFIAFFMSHNYLRSEWSRKELDIVMSRRLSKRGGAIVLPILLEDVEIPALLRDVMYLDFRDGDISKAARAFAKAIRHPTIRKRLDK